MASDRARRAADLLLGARQGAPLASESIGWELADPAEAYAVQALVAAELGPVAAWKTGTASPDALPSAAPVFEGLVWRSPARLAASRFHRLGIEVEIAYRLGRDLPARARPYVREEVVAAIDAVLPTIEIVDSRCAACDRLDPLWKLADNQINGGLVVGRVREDWRGIDPQDQPVQLSIDGETVISGRAGNSAGDPLRLLVWMASNLAEHCGGLRAGQVITTGSLTGLRFVEPGARVVADLAGLGAVEVSFET